MRDKWGYLDYWNCDFWGFDKKYVFSSHELPYNTLGPVDKALLTKWVLSPAVDNKCIVKWGEDLKVDNVCVLKWGEDLKVDNV
jgi:hypothetical protein